MEVSDHLHVPAALPAGKSPIGEMAGGGGEVHPATVE
jgi:hypothetical protein